MLMSSCAVYDMLLAPAAAPIRPGCIVSAYRYTPKSCMQSYRQLECHQSSAQKISNINTAFHSHHSFAQHSCNARSPELSQPWTQVGARVCTHIKSLSNDQAGHPSACRWLRFLQILSIVYCLQHSPSPWQAPSMCLTTSALLPAD